MTESIFIVIEMAKFSRTLMVMNRLTRHMLTVAEKKSLTKCESRSFDPNLKDNLDNRPTPFINR